MNKLYCGTLKINVVFAMGANATEIYSVANDCLQKELKKHSMAELTDVYRIMSTSDIPNNWKNKPIYQDIEFVNAKTAEEFLLSEADNDEERKFLKIKEEYLRLKGKFEP